VCHCFVDRASQVMAPSDDLIGQYDIDDIGVKSDLTKPHCKR